MSFDADEEILQDFLVEAGEILEQLQEQLVDLEQRPDDGDLLNAVFRGFHTIKGGASFLGLTPMVEICHRAEDVFNVLRNHERQVDSELMDVILPVLDILNDMFDSVRGGVMPESADPELLQKLEVLAKPAGAAPAAAPEPAAPAAEPEPAPAAQEPAAQEPAAEADADSEFESMLSALDSDAEAPAAAGGSDEITEEEFEALLDQLHGEGRFVGAPTAAEKEAAAAEAPAEPPKAEASTGGGNDDEISEDEFDALLDQLYGSGKAPGVGGAPPAADASGAASPEPEKTPEPAKKPEPEKKAEPAKQADKPADKKPDSAKVDQATQQATQAETTVRVDTKRLDEIMNMVGELVLVRNRMVNLEQKLGNSEITTVVSNLDVVTSDLQSSVMKTRMQPVKKVFGRFPRVIRDLARSLNKEIKLEMEGEDTDLDKNLVEALADPLVHLVRNAGDHGIEEPDVREAKGKPRAGTVLLSAQQEGDHILLVISDDGAGMDPDKLRRKAVEKGVMDEESASRLDDKAAFNLIFAAGFSMKTEITDVSGRGVGMDVVKTKISQLNGSVDIDSVLGEGTRINVKVPLTLAIIPTLMIVVGEQTFALPLVNVSEIFDLDLSETNVVDGQKVVMVREKPMPLFYLSDWLVRENRAAGRAVEHHGKEEGEESHVVVVHVGNQKIGLVVDALIGQEEVVIKPLGAMLDKVQGMAGATITGDGMIALILDVPSLLKKYGQRAARFHH